MNHQKRERRALRSRERSHRLFSKMENGVRSFTHFKEGKHADGSTSETFTNIKHLCGKKTQETQFHRDILHYYSYTLKAKLIEYFVKQLEVSIPLHYPKHSVTTRSASIFLENAVIKDCRAGSKASNGSTPRLYTI